MCVVQLAQLFAKVPTGLLPSFALSPLFAAYLLGLGCALILFAQIGKAVFDVASDHSHHRDT